ncbi:MAG: hypothetical protein QXX87_06345 [Candidatus Jordarchaeales archaeon]
MSFFPIFEVHGELSKLVRDPFKGFVLVSEHGFLVDTSFEAEDEINKTLVIANWVKIVVDRIRSELKLNGKSVTIALSLGEANYIFRQLGAELYIVLVMDKTAIPVLGRDEELVLQRVESMIEGKPLEDVEVPMVERPVIEARSVAKDPYEMAESALKLFREAVLRAESMLAGSSMISDLGTLASAAQRLESSLNAFKKILEQLEGYSRDIGRLSELTFSLANALESMKNYSEKLLEMLRSVRETIISSRELSKPSAVEEAMNKLKNIIETGGSPSEVAETLNNVVNQLVRTIGYIHPSLYEMKSYYRLFKEATPSDFEMLKKEFLSSIERWKMRLMSVERVLSS